MITDEQIRSLVRVGMRYSQGWALYQVIKIEIISGTVLKLEFRAINVDTKQKIVNIYPNGGIE